MVAVEWLLSHPSSYSCNYLALLLLLAACLWPSLEVTSIVLPFQNPPQPSVVWPASVPLQNLERPQNWRDKDFGQWCRNFTVDRFVCCGKDGVECCGGIQTWAYVVFGSLILSVLIILTFYLLLHFQLICGTWTREERREDSPCTLLTSSTTPLSSPCSYSPTGSGDSSKPITIGNKESNSCFSTLIVVVEDHRKEHT